MHHYVLVETLFDLQGQKFCVKMQRCVFFTLFYAWCKLDGILSGSKNALENVDFDNIL